MKLIILDRDGVINHDSEAYIKSADEWRPLPGSLEAIARLSHAGYRIAVATNQAGVARGLFDLATLGAIHAKMHQAVVDAGGRIDAIFFCPHGPDSDCNCRKPKPGMALEIIRRFQANAAETLLVGDTMRDLQAGLDAGCKPVLVRTGHGAQTEAHGSLPNATVVHDSLASLALVLAP